MSTRLLFKLAFLAQGPSQCSSALQGEAGADYAHEKHMMFARVSFFEVLNCVSKYSLKIHLGC